jgi:hypothetical protein
MIYSLYYSRWANLWDTVRAMVQENYYDENEHSDTLFNIGMSPTMTSQQVLEAGEYFYNRKFKKLINYQLEPLVYGHWYSPDGIIKNMLTLNSPVEMEIWDYDLDNCRFLIENRVNSMFKPMRPTKELMLVENKPDPEIDILYYGSFVGNRTKTLSEYFNYHGTNDYHFVWVHGVTGKELDNYIANSKIVLNLNSENRAFSVQHQVRIFYLLCNKKCVVSEKARRNYYEDYIYEFEGANDLINVTEDILMTQKWKNVREWKNV